MNIAHLCPQLPKPIETWTRRELESYGSSNDRGRRKPPSSTMLPKLTVLFLLLASWGPSLKASTFDNPQNESRISAISETLKSLKAVKLSGEQRRWGEVPDDARTQLTELKHELWDVLSDAVASQRGGSLSPKELSEIVLKELHRGGIEVKAQDCHQAYGCIVQLGFQQPSGYPDLLVATSIVTAYCARDASLYIFDRKGAQYGLALSLESDDYRETTAAQNQLRYAILAAPEATDQWSVVTTHVEAACASSSVWRKIRLRILRPSGIADRPEVLLNQNEDAQLADENNYSLTAGGNTFTLTYGGSMILDGGIESRRHVAKYRVTATGVTRLPPVASLPQDFVDEWIQLPWSQASFWNKSADLARIQEWHDRIRSAKSAAVHSKLVSVQQCGEGANNWQVALAIALAGGIKSLSDDVYFSISKEDDSYFVTDIRSVRARGCPGQSAPAQNYSASP
jgi:hypothetical protein